jgi:hypothetical protein
MTVTEDQIKYMVDRFLGWRVPKDFRPDAGISYTRPDYPLSMDATPYGTNLFNAVQADAMVRHMVEGAIDWHPIETSPSDEEVILGLWDSDDGLNYRWRAKVGWAKVRNTKPPGRNFTHWMPIPQPPK